MACSITAYVPPKDYFPQVYDLLHKALAAKQARKKPAAQQRKQQSQQHDRDDLDMSDLHPAAQLPPRAAAAAAAIQRSQAAAAAAGGGAGSGDSSGSDGIRHKQTPGEGT